MDNTPAAKPRRFYPNLLIGLLALVIGLSHLGELLWQRDDIWWTPLTLMRPVAEERERLQLFVGETPLETLAEQGRLLVQGDEGPRPLRAEELRVRLNNWDRIRAEGRWEVAAAAFFITLGVLFSLLGLGELLGRLECRRMPPGGRQ
jgi:hypothetical protein